MISGKDLEGLRAVCAFRSRFFVYFLLVAAHLVITAQLTGFCRIYLGNCHFCRKFYQIIQISLKNCTTRCVPGMTVLSLSSAHASKPVLIVKSIFDLFWLEMGFTERKTPWDEVLDLQIWQIFYLFPVLNSSLLLAVVSHPSSWVCAQTTLVKMCCDKGA